ncbi:MAG TPA: adenylate/guanylate cyclase domain-containing protein [Candidatus Limnocylindrales bacterium]|jgi:class 3 adenylate cyclase|nr:adenylate/guanylate cyclase domain-containing protein [Candidatus Limnocylindrales bacterium]
MANLRDRDRARLPDAAFAYVDSAGRRRLPIHDAAHVRNALARFERVDFEDEAARDRARLKVLRAARRHGVSTIGFLAGQLEPHRRLPSGTVTFLLCDIEASTELLHRLGDKYARLRTDLRRLVRSAVRRAGGREVDTRADEFLAVFGEAPGALVAALEVQRSLPGREWAGGVAPKVRMGIHSGRPTLTSSGYVGLAVHAAARICSAGHGGQVVVSRAAARAIGELPPGVGLRGLGEHRLAGLPEAIELLQLTGEGLAADFPPLRSA